MIRARRGLGIFMDTNSQFLYAFGGNATSMEKYCVETKQWQLMTVDVP